MREILKSTLYSKKTALISSILIFLTFTIVNFHNFFIIDGNLRLVVNIIGLMINVLMLTISVCAFIKLKNAQ